MFSPLFAALDPRRNNQGGTVDRFNNDPDLLPSGDEFDELNREIRAADARRALRECKLEDLQRELKRRESDKTEREQLLEQLEGQSKRNTGDLAHALANMPPGLATGYEDLDRLVSFPAGSLSIIAGRPSHGKSAFLQNAYQRAVYREDKPFAFFSYEVNWLQVLTRFVLMESGADLDPNRNYEALQSYLREKRNDLENIETARKRIDAMIEAGRMLVYDTAFNVAALVEAIRMLHTKKGIAGAFVDYIQLIPPRDADRRQTRQVQIQGIAAELRELAKELRIPIVTAAQLNRESDKAGKPLRPRLSQLRESGDLEQEADVVLGLFNPQVADVQESEDQALHGATNLEIKVLKNRNGRVNDTATLQFNGATLTVNNRSGF